jgi:hypothetical protein
MFLRRSMLALAAVLGIASTLLAPVGASARCLHGGHHIIVVCHKSF